MRKLLFGIFLVFSLMIVLSYEVPLSNLGFNGLELNGAGLKECKSLDINLASEQYFNEGTDGILSLSTEFIGEASDNSYLGVSIDGQEETIIWPELFSCNNECWARIFVPKLNQRAVNIKICLNTGGKTSSAKINSTSKIGLYSSPVLTITNQSPEQIILGQRAQMKIKIENNGSLNSNVFVQFVAQDLRSFLEITGFDIVEGDASASTLLKKGEEKEFIYYIKPTLASSYNLPSAVLFFDNIFGEKQKIASNHPQLDVTSPDQINLILIGEGLEENVFKVRVTVKNNWDKKFEGQIKITPVDLFEGEQEIIINENGQKEFYFTTKKLEKGKYSLIAQIDSNGVTYFSDSVSFEVVNQDFGFEIILSIIAIIVALGIFVLIYSKK